MSPQIYLGVDLGAESGRVMAGHWDGERIRLEAVHRFANGPVNLAGTLRWDTLRLWQEVLNGLTLAAQNSCGRIVSVGVDTWAVDYVLLSSAGEMLGHPHNYRDARTAGLVEAAFGIMSREEIFSETGLQFLELNTLYQLMAHLRDSPETLAAADRLMMIPDWLHWCLCGVAASEFTNATTTQLFHPVQRGWSDRMIRAFQLPRRIFGEVIEPGTRLGPLRESVRQITGLGEVSVVAPATHDTASAVVSAPAMSTGRVNWAYISSGTWSLIGVEAPRAVLTPQVLERNFTNEGGVDGTWRLLKNVMGLWIVQQLKRAFEARGLQNGYERLMDLAAEAAPLRSLIDPDDHRFFRSSEMPRSIEEFCLETGQAIPQTEGQFVRCVLESLALRYAVVLESIEQITGERIEAVHVVGGGSKSVLLNRFTADCCGRPVIAGPVEATATGNIMMQVRAAGEIRSLSDIRAVVRNSFREELREYHPDPAAAAQWAEARGRFGALILR